MPRALSGRATRPVANGELKSGAASGQFCEQIDDGTDHGRLELGPVGLVVDLGHLAVPDDRTH
jgi:hypothetical protein